MCGRFTYLGREELSDIVDALNLLETGGSPVSGNGGAPVRLQDCAQREQARPRSYVQTIVPDGQRFDVATFTWGFRPTSSTDVVFNTRIESALSGTPLWREPLRDGRCIVPVATFFEPHRTEKAISPKTGRQVKRQYEFADPQGAPLLLAGIHDSENVSVLTTEPNEAVRSIHNRMPLILRFEEVPLWIDGDFAQLADRSHVKLDVRVEEAAAPSGFEQLSLF